MTDLLRHVDPARLPARWRARFEPLPADPFIEAFARGEHAPPHGALRGHIRRILRLFVSDFDADGWLRTNPMALLGERSWEALVGRGGRLLDVGAGAGDITLEASGLFDTIVTTETSAPMARRLRARGLPCHRVDLARAPLAGEAPFDVVSLLDVLDRCARPRSLLRAALRHLRDEGRVLISVPLPARPHAYLGAWTVDPEESLTGDGDTFEEALVDLVEGTIEPCGVKIDRLARAPYLSRGAVDAPLHVLDAALVVGRRVT